MLNDNVKKVLENSMWDWMESQMLLLWLLRVFLILIKDIFLETTLKNVLENNGEIAIGAYDASSLDGYQIQGKAK